MIVVERAVLAGADADSRSIIARVVGRRVVRHVGRGIQVDLILDTLPDAATKELDWIVEIRSNAHDADSRGESHSCHTSDVR